MQGDQDARYGGGVDLGAQRRALLCLRVCGQ